MATQPSFSTLPTEIHLLIISHLPILETQMLRMVHEHFYTLIPRATPTGLELLAAHGNPFIKDTGLLGCNYCLCLLRASKFDDKMRWRDPGERFCMKCGSRPITRGKEDSTFRYGAGDTWEDGGVRKGYCVWCDSNEPMPEEPDPREQYGREEGEKYEWRSCTVCLNGDFPSGAKWGLF